MWHVIYHSQNWTNRLRYSFSPSCPAFPARSVSGDTVVDVGANIGVFGACALSSVLNGDIRYIAVEPCPKTFRVLQQNLLGDGGQGQQNSIFHLNWQLAAPLQGAAAGRYCPAYPGGIALLPIKSGPRFQSSQHSVYGQFMAVFHMTTQDKAG